MDWMRRQYRKSRTSSNLLLATIHRPIGHKFLVDSKQADNCKLHKYSILSRYYTTAVFHGQPATEISPVGHCATFLIAHIEE